MGKATAARKAALNIMRAIRSGELADRAFARQVANIPPRDVPFLHELIYGTQRLRGRMDYVLSTYVRKGLDSLDDDVLDVLRLGAYQLLEMRSVPAYAAVSQSVELAKTLSGRGASGLVNGVLQNMRRDQEDIGAPSDDTVEQLTHWGSHPRWLVERWIANYGEEATAQIVENNNTPPSIYLQPLGGADPFRVEGKSVEDALAETRGIIQDPAAGLVARYASPRGIVADLCAAPGGKSVVMADMLHDDGFVMASDVSPKRIGRVKENVERLGELPVGVVVADARKPAIRAADTVLIDVPCTGTGTFRRHPDGKWRLTPDDLIALTQLQSAILDAAADVVKVGGILIYSTCSIEPEENEKQVTAFLDRNSNFLRRPPAGWHDASLLDDVGNLVVLPHRSGFDGSFACRMERVS